MESGEDRICITYHYLKDREITFDRLSDQGKKNTSHQHREINNLNEKNHCKIQQKRDKAELTVVIKH